MAKQSGKTTKSSVSQIPETRVKLDLLRVEQMLEDFGGSGTQLVNGFLESDYNSDLAGSTGLIKYDKMRKSDAQINATLMCMELPIRSTEWYIEPAKDDNGEVTPEAQEHADFVEMALFEKMEQTWDDTLREILTMLPFGFCVQEKVFTADEQFVWLKKLAYRKQTTIGRWQTQDGQAGVTQYLPAPIVGGENDGKLIVSIPANKLLIFSFRREGDNLAGVSVLRSAYKHWYIKDSLYKFDNIRHERQSVGVPVIVLPEESGPEDRVLAEAILNRVRANEQAGIVLPSNKWEFKFADLQAGNTSDVWKSIEHHNQMISKNILAMFMELASGDGGSRALSEDQSDFFLLALEAIAKQIDDVMSTYLIKELVDLNFDGVESYPRLTHKKLGSIDYSTIANTLATLAGSELITPDDELETWVRETMDLPPAMSPEEMEEGIEEGVQELDEEGNPIEEEPMVDEEGNPIEDDMMEEGEEEDDDDISDDDEDAADDELADLEDQLGDVDPDEEELNNEEDEDDKKKKKPRFFEIENDVFAFYEGEWYESEGEEFRIVSEATKRKISESLKKALPNKPVKPPRYRRGQPLPDDIKRKISETLERVKPNKAEPVKKGRKMRSLAQRSIRRRKSKTPTRLQQQRNDPNSPLYKKKLGGQIKKRRDARLKKAGKTVSDKSIKNKVQQAINQVGSGAAPKKATKQKKPKVSKKKIERVKTAIKMAKTPKSRAKVKAQVLKLRRAVAKRKAARVKKLHEHEQGITAFDENYQRYADILDNKFILKLQANAETDEDRAAIRRKGFMFNDFEEQSWRPMTFAERKVNFTSLKKAVDKFNKTLAVQSEESLVKMKDDLLNQVKRAVEKSDIAAVGKIKAKYTGEIASALTEVQKEMFEIGKQSAAAEMGVKAVATAGEVKGAMRVQNQKLVDALSNDMEAAASKAVTELAAKKGGSITNTGTAEAVAAAGAAIDKAVENAKGAMQTLSVIGSLNMGRTAVFERYPEKVYAMQYSAIIDGVTTDTCLALDGRVVLAGSDDFYKYSPPRHYNCRSIWVEILQDEEFKPETGDVPAKIPANATIDTFEDMKAPEIKVGSPAIKVLEAEIAERQAKVDDYRSSGIFPNRVQQHENRIDALKKALEKADPSASAEMNEHKGGMTYSFFDHMKEILTADGVHFRPQNGG